MSRRTKYQESFNERIIELAKDNKFMQEIAAEFGVCTLTMRHWREKYEEFEASYKIAQTIIVAQWLRKGADNISDRMFNSRVFESVLNYITNEKDRRNLPPAALKGDTVQEKLLSAVTCANNGMLRAEEFKTLIDAIQSMQNIQIAQDLEARIAALEETASK